MSKSKDIAALNTDAKIKTVEFDGIKCVGVRDE